MTPNNPTDLTRKEDPSGTPSNDPYSQYKSQSLSTLAPGELLVKLFEELIKQTRLAILAINKKDYGASNDALLKGQTIVSTLAGSLDMRYPISKQLKNMYIFLSQQLLQANISKDVKLLEDCAVIMKELRDSFAQAERISRRNQHQKRQTQRQQPQQPQRRAAGGEAV